MHEYGVKVLRSELVTRALFENRAVRGLLGAIPGLDAYALLGKAWFHTTEMRDGRPRYDLVIFDGPASGHAALDAAHPAGDPERDAEGAARRATRARSRTAEGPGPRRAADRHARRGAAGTRGGRARRAGAARCPCRSARGGQRAADRTRCRRPRSTRCWAVACRTAASPQPATDAPLAATLRMAAGVRAHREAAERALGDLKRDLGLPMITLPRIPTAEIGPAIIAELTPHLAEQLR